MARHGLLTGAVVAAGLAAAAAVLAPPDVTAGLVAQVTAASARPAAAAKAALPKAVSPRAAVPPVAPKVAAPLGPGGPAPAASPACSCRKALPRPAAVRGPQVVTQDDPPSARLVGPATGGTDRGIADTGVHSDGTWPAGSWKRRYRPDSRVPLTVTPARGSVLVTWPHNGDPATIRYRVGYQPQSWVRSTTDPTAWTLPPIVWVDVRPLGAEKEGTQRWTLRPATSGVRYSFWLEVDVSTPETTTDARMTVGQQEGVLVP